MMNRKTIKAALSKGRTFPVQSRRAFYRAEAVGFHWPMTEAEAAFSAAVVARLPVGCIFYHGGPEGLPVGADILPAKDTGQDPQGLRGAIPARLTHAHVTTSFLEAAIYAGRAAGNGAGAVYRVTPAQPLEMDPEAIRCIRLMLSDADVVRALGQAGIIEAETAFRCPSAKIEEAAAILPWAGSSEATRAQALPLAMALDPPQITGPEGWAGNVWQALPQ